MPDEAGPGEAASPGKAGWSSAHAASSTAANEARNDGVLRDLLAPQHAHGSAVVEDRDTVTEANQLLGVRGVQDTGGAGPRKVAQHLVELELRLHVDPARRVDEQQDRGVARHELADHDLLLSAAAQRGDGLEQRGQANRHPLDRRCRRRTSRPAGRGTPACDRFRSVAIARFQRTGRFRCRPSRARSSGISTIPWRSASPGRRILDGLSLARHRAASGSGTVEPEQEVALALAL